MDAQMRALTMSQEVLIRQLIEQNEELKKQNALFSEEVTKNREEIEKLKVGFNFHQIDLNVIHSFISIE